jgi:hypothetical protein
MWLSLSFEFIRFVGFDRRVLTIYQISKNKASNHSKKRNFWSAPFYLRDLSAIIQILFYQFTKEGVSSVGFVLSRSPTNVIHLHGILTRSRTIDKYSTTTKLMPSQYIVAAGTTTTYMYTIHARYKNFCNISNTSTPLAIHIFHAT